MAHPSDETSPVRRTNRALLLSLAINLALAVALIVQEKRHALEIDLLNGMAINGDKLHFGLHSVSLSALTNPDEEQAESARKALAAILAASEHKPWSVELAIDLARPLRTTNRREWRRAVRRTDVRAKYVGS